MVLAHRSIVRAATAAQSFRAAPVTRQSVQLLGRRFKSTGGSYEKGYTSSDLPWLAVSTAVTVPMIFYLWPSGSGEHHDAHEDERTQGHGEKDGEIEEDPEGKPTEGYYEAPEKEQKVETEKKADKKEVPEEKKNGSKEDGKDEKPKEDDSTTDNKDDKKVDSKAEEAKRDESREDAGKSEDNDSESKN
ncbi:hypothetical protein Pdw03_6262 [Penicillium digitatum]|nr:hypothetical protein Pdw03_6262 [Penicillium digitatum]